VLSDQVEVLSDLRLDVRGAGVTRWIADAYPVDLNVWVAVVVDLEPGERGNPQAMRVEINKAGAPGGRFLDITVTPAPGIGLADDETLQQGFAVDLGGVRLPEPGRYEVRLILEDQPPRLLPIRAYLASDPAVRVGPTH